MSPEERYALAMEVTTWLEDKKGQQLLIREAITNRNYDRHGTSSVSFRMILENVATRFSGARTMLDGTQGELYEFAIDNITGTILPDKLELIELLANKDAPFPLLRRTIIQLV